MNSLYIFKKYPVTERIYRVCFGRWILSKKEISKELGKNYWAGSTILHNINRLIGAGYLEFLENEPKTKIKYEKPRRIYSSSLKPFFEYAEIRGIKFSEEEAKIMEGIKGVGIGFSRKKGVFSKNTVFIRDKVLSKSDVIEGIISFLSNCIVYFITSKLTDYRYDSKNRDAEIDLYRSIGNYLLSKPDLRNKLLKLIFGEKILKLDLKNIANI